MIKKPSFDQSIPYIFLGGLVGSILRFGVFTGLDDLVNHRSKLIVINPNHVEGLLISLLHYLPIGTLVVNLLGSFVLALLARCLLGRIRPHFYNLFATGLIGSFTTFSTFSRDFCQLVLDGHPIPGLIYIFLSIFGGLLMAILGNNLGKKVSKC